MKAASPAPPASQPRAALARGAAAPRGTQPGEGREGSSRPPPFVSCDIFSSCRTVHALRTSDSIRRSTTDEEGAGSIRREAAGSGLLHLLSFFFLLGDHLPNHSKTNQVNGMTSD